MVSSKASLSIGLAIVFLLSAVAATFAARLPSVPETRVSMTNPTARTSTPAAHSRRQGAGGRRRHSAHRFKASPKKTRRVPKAKSLSVESY